jgi:hypothetical protein
MKRILMLLALAAVAALAVGTGSVLASDDEGGVPGTTPAACTPPTGQTGANQTADSRIRASSDGNQSGTSGDDNEQGDNADNQIQGQAGDDEINGDEGDDDLCGDEGDRRRRPAGRSR